MIKMKNLNLYVFLLLLGLSLSACKINKSVEPIPPTPAPVPTVPQVLKLADFRSGGGSSGMEQIGENTYIVVYDVKNFKDGTRVGLVKISEESLDVYPIAIDNWGEEGQSSDLESICSVPGRENEFLMAESGNWQGKLGRIFHIKVDTSILKAKVLGSVKLPFLHRNDFGLKGDQYEAMLCLLSLDNKVRVVLGERGGSKVNPKGVIRWGILDFNNYTLEMTESGLKGIEIEAPGKWENSRDKRDITDFHVDEEGAVWAVASEDQGDFGPFYSVVYKVGQLYQTEISLPIVFSEKKKPFKEVNGFKIEALSGPCKGIDSSHSFGTEDEIYGGVWRPLDMGMEK